MEQALNWHSRANLALLNPRLNPGDAAELRGWLDVAARALEAHVFLLTSGSSAGSTAECKWVALSKQAVLAGADAANRHLASTARDVWLQALPEFHIGGLSIGARALLSGARVERLELAHGWDARRFTARAEVAHATLASLVPAQIFDLVSANLQAPPSLRAILVGGSALDPELAARARALGWPLLATYGMTETASQVATETRGAPGALTLLAHIDADTTADERIRVRGPSLLSGYVRLGAQGPEFHDPKVDGWLTTEDLGEVQGTSLTIAGRASERIKIGGELSHLGRLRRTLEREAGLEAPHLALATKPDARLESVVWLYAEEHVSDARLAEILSGYHARTLPFEKVRGIERVNTIPRTALGKVSWKQLACAPSPSP